jgi:protein-disulfide isomerase
VLLVLICHFAAAGESIRAIPAEIQKRVEQQVRQYAEAPPDAGIRLGELQPSEFAGFYTLPVTIDGVAGQHTFTFLLSRDYKRLLYMKSFDLTDNPYAKVIRSIDLAGRPIRGRADAPVTVVMYDDLQCPFCAEQYIALMNEAMNAYRDRVKVVLKDFPLTESHAWAMDAAITADCLAAHDSDAYWAFADYVHTHQQAMTDRWKQSHAAFEELAVEQGKRAINPQELHACVTAHDVKGIEKSLAEGRALGVSATPATFINGEFFEGVLTREQIRAALDRALKEASTTASR